jgi:hypothetical protein
MVWPDKFFALYDHDFPIQTRDKARILFRRAVREYYVTQRKFVIDPESGARVRKLLIGEFVQKQKNQRRKVKRFHTGQKAAGRPKRPEIKLLIARLFVLWCRYATSKATFSWKTAVGNPTRFELFLRDLLPQLGARDVRRYVEAHWRERK